MSIHSLSAVPPARSRRSPTSWLESRPLWAGLSIITMWLAVLFVGLFGGDIVSATAGGTSSSVPVVVVVAGVALIGTIVVGRRAFSPTFASEDVWRALAGEQQAREELADEVADLQAKVSAPERKSPVEAEPPVGARSGPAG